MNCAGCGSAICGRCGPRYTLTAWGGADGRDPDRSFGTDVLSWCDDCTPPPLLSEPERHEVGSPILMIERGRWRVECSCGWESGEEKSDGGARYAGQEHLNAHLPTPAG